MKLAAHPRNDFSRGALTWRKWKVPGICALLAALVWGVFGQTMRFDFIDFDDMFIYQSPEITRGLTPQGIAWAFTHSHGDLWLPLTTLTHMLDCQIYGLWPGGHHLTNVLLQAATAILLFLVLLRMTGALWRSAFVAALFAIHPLRVESVAWVTERKDVLSGLFFMLTLWEYTKYARHPESTRGYAMTLVWFALGLMSKSMLVTVPFVLILLDYWPLGRLQNASQLPILLKEKIPFLALSILSSVAALLAAKRIIQPADHLSLLPRVGNALIACVIYLEKLIHPGQLAVFYPLVKGGGGALKVIGASLLLAALTAGVCVSRRKHPYLLVGWLWYLGMLAPVIGIVQVGVQAYADRFTYLPQIGLCLAGVWAAADWAGGRRERRYFLVGTAAVAVSLLALAAYRQAGYWQDSITLWTHTLACTPDNIVARYTLGNALAQQGRNEEAVVQYRDALQFDPTFAEGHSNLGIALFRQGQPEQGIAQLREALRLNPDSPETHCNLGNALFEHGKPEEAISEFREALRLNPAYERAHHSLGRALLARGQTDEAILELREASRLNPADKPVQNDLARALLEHRQTGHPSPDRQ